MLLWLAYAHRYEVDRAFLLYPHHPAPGLTGLKREYQIQGRVRLSVVTLDLARLDSIPPVLMETTGRELPAHLTV